MKTNRNTSRNAWIGVVLVAIGGYYLLRNLHFIPSFIPHYFFDWEMIFILIGGAMLATGRRAGVVFLAIGAISLLPQVFLWPHIYIRDWWPLILIAIGVSILMKRRHEGYQSQRAGTTDDEYIDEVSILGGSEKTITSRNFKGGKITSLFGGSKINFLNAELSPDENILDVFCMFGGSTLIVPSDWTIIMDSFIIFGGYSDKRPFTSNVSPNPDKVLRIKGFVMFGGGEIKSV
ncbi:MAG: DUF5668 domain-containing protein [Cyclobacteriaceae bacterium]